MKEIYSNAIFNIAATVAPNGHSGLFRDRRPAPIPPVQITVTWELTMAGVPPSGIYFIGRTSHQMLDIDAMCLNQRAWVLQGRYLSPRIVHFSLELLYWECQELFADELYPNGLPPVA